MQDKKRGELKVKVFIFVSILILILFVSLISAERLPIVNGDSNGWGTILNNYLTKLAGLNATKLNGTMVNGTNIYPSSINTTQILNGTIIDADISDTTNLTLGKKITFTLGEVIDNIVDGWITITGGLNVTGNLTGNWATFTNLNVTGTSYLGDITITADNITTNGIISKDGNISFYNSAGSEKVRIMSDGNVGIGVTNPDTQLEIFKAGNQLKLSYDADSFATFLLDANDDLTIKPAASGGIRFQPTTTDTIDFFQVLDQDGGTPVLNVDVTNERVGIGTNAPSQLLEVSGGDAKIGVTGSSGGAAIYLKETLATTTWAEWQKTDTSLRVNANNGSNTRTDMFTILDTGNVGIGDSTPDVKLEVGGQIRAKGDTPTNGGGYAFTSPGDADGGMFSTADGTLQFYTNNVERLRINSNGDVAIGAFNPVINLAIGDSDTGLAQGGDGVLNFYTNNGIRMSIDTNGYANFNSLVRLGTDRTNALLVIDTAETASNYGAISINHNDNDAYAIDIYGVSTKGIKLGSAVDDNCYENGAAAVCSLNDYAEIMEFSELPNDGELVIIDVNNPGKLRVSNKPYDSLIVGIASEEPAMVIGSYGITIKGWSNEDNKSIYPLAIAGRKIVKVNNENGIIMPGDLLVSSSEKGKAMRCPREEYLNKCMGAIVGKAMTGEENGQVLALIMMQ